MKTIYPYILLLLFLGTPAFVSCSDDDAEEEMEEIPQENQEPGEQPQEQDSPGFISPEILEKVTEIYSQATIGPQRVTTVHQLAILTSLCASREGDGPITVTRAQLNGEAVTLVTLGGTEMVDGQATSMEESQLAAMGKSNDYLKAVVKLFNDSTISPKNPVLVSGISLGGMIAQQLLGEPQILEKFDLRAVITFGSPLTLPFDRKGVKVVRFADVHDKVPSLGESMLRMGLVKIPEMSKSQIIEKMDALDQKEKVVRTSKYSGMIETHALSYVEDECWLDVDFLGDKAKNNVLELIERMKFYAAPKHQQK